MWCLVAQPNATKNADLVIEVKLNHKATGQECLNQVCQKLGIIESDYFGLQYTTARKEEIWLNLRNEIRQEVHAHPFRASSSDGGKPSAIRFRLRVKFWVPPHLILQETTRHQFFLQARVDLVEGQLTVTDAAAAIRICGLIAQAELGDATGMPSQTESYLLSLPFSWPTTGGKLLGMSKNEWILKILQQHMDLKGMSSTLAEYWMLKEVSQLKDYGTETFRARWILPSKINSSHRESVQSTVAVNPQGVCISSLESNHRLSVPFCAVQAATNHNVRFLLKHRTDLGNIECAALKLETYHASIALYRSITEKHAFYSCETVRSAVTSQFVRDLKGTIASFFNENTDLGKKYIFDIQRTCREVYDNARRILYQADSTCPGPLVPSLTLTDSSKSCNNPSCKTAKDQLIRLQEALLCRICMDDDISAVFCPCGHALACSSCAQRCTQCPVCRAEVTHTQPIFLPLSTVKEREIPRHDHERPGPSCSIHKSEFLQISTA